MEFTKGEWARREGGIFTPLGHPTPKPPPIRPLKSRRHDFGSVENHRYPLSFPLSRFLISDAIIRGFVYGRFV
jgi:hypothetical protein